VTRTLRVRRTSSPSIELILRAILNTRRDAETWAIVREQVPRVLQVRAQAVRDGWWN
jgi:hypothetical protein